MDLDTGQRPKHCTKFLTKQMSNENTVLCMQCSHEYLTQCRIMFKNLKKQENLVSISELEAEAHWNRYLAGGSTVHVLAGGSTVHVLYSNRSYCKKASFAKHQLYYLKKVLGVTLRKPASFSGATHDDTNSCLLGHILLLLQRKWARKIKNIAYSKAVSQKCFALPGFPVI